MNIKNIVLTSLLTLGCATASAEKVEEVEVFNPHWYGGVQVGAQYTLGELDFSDLCSLNGQLSLGYQFTPVWGARLTLNGWQSKAGTPANLGLSKDYDWSWNYITPTVDVTFSLTNAIFGFKADRKIDLGVFAGIGANFASGNDEAKDAHLAIQKDPLFHADRYDSSCPNRLLWEDSKTFLNTKFGATLDYNVTRNVSLGVEVAANMVNDHYNSKKAGNIDWYMNGLVGLKYKFGSTTRKEYRPIDTVIETVTEIVHDTVFVEIPVECKLPHDVKEPIRRDIFFVIRGSQISNEEAVKVQELVAYMYKYPEAKIAITGYADRGTGNPQINVGYAQKRAQVVANTLATKFGIDRSRMIVDSKGDTEQPYAENDRNRVTICIAE